MKRLSATVTRDPHNKNKWYARLQYYDAAGKRVAVCRSAERKDEAEELLEELRKKYATGVIDSRHKTFSELADELKATRYGPARYSETGKRLSGARTSQKAASVINRLVMALGHKKLSAITLVDLEQYKSDRFKAVKIATINRELSLLRAMLNTAVRRKYLAISPFAYAARGELIDVEAEDSRNVTITSEQEKALLAQCQTEGRRHLRALIIALLDSGCRLGELLSLRWSDINWSERYFVVTSYKGKNMTQRKVPLISRTRDAFLGLRERPSRSAFRQEGTDKTLVFGIRTNVATSFAAARHDAGLDHLRLHDLRHTAATRLAEAGMNLAHVGQILGHRSEKTTKRYVNQTDTVLDTAWDALERKAQ